MNNKKFSNFWTKSNTDNVTYFTNIKFNYKSEKISKNSQSDISNL